VGNLAKMLTGSKSVQTLILGWYVPVLVAAFLFVVVLYPPISHTGALTGIRTSAHQMGLHRAWIFVVFTLVWSIVMSLNSRLFYRLIEGYLWPKKLRSWRTNVHALQWDVLYANRDVREAESTEDPAALAVAEARLAKAIDAQTNRRHTLLRGPLRKVARPVPWFVNGSTREYPDEEKRLLPTRFGNRMRAFESYGATQYRLDSQTLWYELTAQVPKEIRDSLSSANIVSDSFICTLYMFLGLATIAFLVGGVYSRTSAFVLGAASLVIVLVSHRRLLASTDEWRYAVQALVNIGRKPLAASLGFALPSTLETEREMWNAVTNHVVYRNMQWGEETDQFRVISPRSSNAVAAGASPAATDGAFDTNDDGFGSPVEVRVGPDPSDAAQVHPVAQTDWRRFLDLQEGSRS